MTSAFTKAHGRKLINLKLALLRRARLYLFIQFTLAWRVVGFTLPSRSNAVLTRQQMAAFLDLRDRLISEVIASSEIAHESSLQSKDRDSGNSTGTRRKSGILADKRALRGERGKVPWLGYLTTEGPRSGSCLEERKAVWWPSGNAASALSQHLQEFAAKSSRSLLLKQT